MLIDKIAAIIPAYKPDEKLLNTLHSLVEKGFKRILVIDDGSGAEFEDIFTSVTKIPECTLLRHPVNRGKGAALKTAFRYFLDNERNMLGVVTADADGQHLSEDIVKVSEKMAQTEKVILGCRDFSEEGVPARSKSGNRITSLVFRIFFGMKISDTQTGLRAFPSKYIEAICDAEGDRYEFETNMLFLMNKRSIPYSEVKIATVYIEENRSSHFRVVRDSIRIYGLIIKYLFSAVAALIIDTAAFHVLHTTGVFNFINRLINLPSNTVPQIVARIISSIVNYLLNSKMVFNDKVNKKTLCKYYILAAVQLLVGTVGVALLTSLLSIKDNSPFATIVYILVQMIIYPVSFRIQHKWVFNSKKDEK